MPPISIRGNWDEGYALDLYTTSSNYIGEDVFGHPRFDNTYTTIGKLLYQFKYNGHLDTREQIADIAAPFIASWLSDEELDIILPCPASLSRSVQPVYAIADAISERTKIPYSDQVLVKTSNTPTKNMPKQDRTLEGSIVQTKQARRKCNILLIDDIYETGATANECVRILRQDPLVNKVFFLAIAKKRT